MNFKCTGCGAIQKSTKCRVLDEKHPHKSAETDCLFCGAVAKYYNPKELAIPVIWFVWDQDRVVA